MRIYNYQTSLVFVPLRTTLLNYREICFIWGLMNVFPLCLTIIQFSIFKLYLRAVNINCQTQMYRCGPASCAICISFTILYHSLHSFWIIHAKLLKPQVRSTLTSSCSMDNIHVNWDIHVIHQWI